MKGIWLMKKKKSKNNNAIETLLEIPVQPTVKTSNKFFIFLKRILLSVMFISGMIIVGFGIQYKFAPLILGGVAMIIVTLAFLSCD